MILKKLACVVVYMLLYVFVSSEYTIHKLISAQVMLSSSRSVLYKIWYFYVSLSAARIRFYIAWTLGEIVSNASGLGFRGYDEKTNEPLWDLVTGVHVWQIEVLK